MATRNTLPDAGEEAEEPPASALAAGAVPLLWPPHAVNANAAHDTIVDNHLLTNIFIS
jgi:hypothetical protein